MTEIPAGTRIGEYGVERPLGAGGMGAVYFARHLSSGTAVALKVMHPEAALKDEIRRRFIREARVTMALNHPNVVRILACFEHQGAPVIVMELLDGCSLTDSLSRNPKPGLARTAGIFLRITSAIGTAHALGLVHRDLKPDNIFLLDHDPHVKVLDFGVAKMRKGGGLEESSALTRTGMLVGTPYYMSPEQAFGEKSIDHRSDIWSLGLILYEALLGVLPTRADTLQEVLRRLMTMEFDRLDRIDPSMPKDVADLVAKMLSRDRDKRPSDLREVYEVLSRYGGDLQGVNLTFGGAAAPVMFDEPTNQGSTAVIDRPDGGAPSQSLKLTPQSLKKSHGAGTLVMSESPAARPSNPGPAAGAAHLAGSGATMAGSVAIPQAPPTTRTPSAQKKGGLWMWIVAACLVVACVVVLVTQLR